MNNIDAFAVNRIATQGGEIRDPEGNIIACAVGEACAGSGGLEEMSCPRLSAPFPCAAVTADTFDAADACDAIDAPRAARASCASSRRASRGFVTTALPFGALSRR